VGNVLGTMLSSESRRSWWPPSTLSMISNPSIQAPLKRLNTWTGVPGGII